MVVVVEIQENIFSVGDFSFFKKESATFIKKIEYEVSQNTILP